MKLLTLFFTNLFGVLPGDPRASGSSCDLGGSNCLYDYGTAGKGSTRHPGHQSQPQRRWWATINNVIGPLFSAIRGTFGAINGVLNQFRNLWEQSCTHFS